MSSTPIFKTNQKIINCFNMAQAQKLNPEAELLKVLSSVNPEFKVTPKFIIDEANKAANIMNQSGTYNSSSIASSLILEIATFLYNKKKTSISQLDKSDIQILKRSLRTSVAVFNTGMNTRPNAEMSPQVIPHRTAKKTYSVVITQETSRGIVIAESKDVKEKPTLTGGAVTRGKIQKADQLDLQKAMKEASGIKEVPYVAEKEKIVLPQKPVSAYKYAYSLTIDGKRYNIATASPLPSTYKQMKEFEEQYGKLNPSGISPNDVREAAAKALIEKADCIVYSPDGKTIRGQRMDLADFQEIIAGKDLVVSANPFSYPASFKK